MTKFELSSCDNIKATLNALFPGIIPETFSMSSSKISYLVSEAVGPYFNTLNTEDMKKSRLPFTIHYDKTTNKQVKKKLYIKIRFWSETDSAVKVHHLKTYLMGHATGVLLAEKILSSLEDNEVPLSRLQSFENDGPNVNKTVWNKLDEQISTLPERKGKGLVNISTCNLHVCHNAFQKGHQVFGEDLSELVISLYIWFKLSPSRREDYEEVQRKLGLPAHKFLKHVELRWLTLAPALLRIVEQFDGLKQYFLVDVPAKQPSILHN